MIGTYSTTTTANKDRNKNIELAAEALNGLILQPGEEFSFNKATGERSEAKGVPAGRCLCKRRTGGRAGRRRMPGFLHTLQRSHFLRSYDDRAPCAQL